MDVLKTPLDPGSARDPARHSGFLVGLAAQAVSRDLNLGPHGTGGLPVDLSLGASAGLLAVLSRFSQASNPFTDKELRN